MSQKVKKVRQGLLTVIIIATVAVFSSCEKYTFTAPTIDPSATWHFQTDIQPIFNANCATCHGGARSPDLRDGKSYKALTTGGYVKTPAESSKLYSMMSSSSHISRSSEADRLKVLYWITQGGRNN
jgi:hypothetical protein